MALSKEELEKLLAALEMQSSPKIEKARFAPLKPSAVEPKERDYGLLADVPLKVVAELGRTRLTIREVLELKEGSVISLNKVAGEMVEVKVNGVPLALGEVVVVNEVFGVRITGLLEDGERAGGN